MHFGSLHCFLLPHCAEFHSKRLRLRAIVGPPYSKHRVSVSINTRYFYIWSGPTPATKSFRLCGATGNIIDLCAANLFLTLIFCPFSIVNSSIQKCCNTLTIWACPSKISYSILYWCHCLSFSWRITPGIVGVNR